MVKMWVSKPQWTFKMQLTGDTGLSITEKNPINNVGYHELRIERTKNDIGKVSYFFRYQLNSHRIERSG